VLAARQYIYGMLSTFPGELPDTAEKLDKLTKYAQTRWTDFPGQMQAAKEREAEMRRRQRLRNVVGPVLPPPEVPTERPDTIAGRTEVPDPTKSTGAFTGVKPPPLPKAAAKPPVPVKPVVPAKPGKQPKRRQNQKPLPHGAYPMIDTLNGESFKNFLLECVVNANGDSMSTTLNEAIKLVEEMEADELTASPAAAPLDEPMEPMEPPVSDSAVGADTEEDTALGLLRQMRDSLLQLATALAPEETPEEMAGEEAAADAEGGGGFPSDMPAEPPSDDFGGEAPASGEAEDEDEEEEAPNRRPVEK
jgi:hypothetical protein